MARASRSRLVVCGARVIAGVTGAQLPEGLEGHHLRIVEAVQPLHVEDHDLDELGAALPHGEDLVELLLVLDEEEAGPAIVDDVLDLGGRIGRVDPVGDPADRHGTEVDVQPLGTVVGDNAWRSRRTPAS